MSATSWPQQVIAALKGIAALDEQTAKQGAAAEERYLKSFPFHPELTEVFYAKWAAGIERFQKTRGVLRTFALALREAQKWDESPLVGPAVFLSPPKQDGTVGGGTRTGVGRRHDHQRRPGNAVDGHPRNGIGLRAASSGGFRRAEAAGDRAGGHGDVPALAADRPQCQDPRPDAADRPVPGRTRSSWRRDWDAGRGRSYWLDDTNMPEKEGQLPAEWRLGNRPEPEPDAGGRRGADLRRCGQGPADRGDRQKAKTLTSGASALGVRVHTLPTKPKDIEDDGLFHYAVLPPERRFRFGQAQRRGQAVPRRDDRGRTSLAFSATPCFCWHRRGTGWKWPSTACATTWRGRRSWTT